MGHWPDSLSADQLPWHRALCLVWGAMNDVTVVWPSEAPAVRQQKVKWVPRHHLESFQTGALGQLHPRGRAQASVPGGRQGASGARWGQPVSHDSESLS